MARYWFISAEQNGRLIKGSSLMVVAWSACLTAGRAHPDVSGWRSRLASAGRLMAEPDLAEWEEEAEPSGTDAWSGAIAGRSRVDRAVVKERGERCRVCRYLLGAVARSVAGSSVVSSRKVA